MIRAHAIRLKPNQDLKKICLSLISEKKITAAGIVSAVGSLKVACLRLASAKDIKEFRGPLEIVSLSGTLSQDGAHLHISVADESGQVFGGHLLEGSLVHTTVELIILEMPDLKFSRKLDSETGYQELQIENY